MQLYKVCYQEHLKKKSICAGEGARARVVGRSSRPLRHLAERPCGQGLRHALPGVEGPGHQPPRLTQDEVVVEGGDVLEGDQQAEVGAGHQATGQVVLPLLHSPSSPPPPTATAPTPPLTLVSPQLRRMN